MHRTSIYMPLMALTLAIGAGTVRAADTPPPYP